MIWLIFLIILSLFFLIEIVVRIQFSRCTSKVCLIGKTAVITGGSSGIGFQTALDLACRGCKVIIADKNVSDDIRERLVSESRNPQIYLEFVDLASLNSVRKLAERLKESEEKVDILINNAGVGNMADMLTEDGLNSIYQINYYGSFLLTHLLVDLLKKSPSGRIIFTSSLLSYFNNFFPNDVKNGQIKEKMRFFDYPNSKLMQIVASDIFAKKLNKFNITSNAYHPGVVKTPIVSQITAFLKKPSKIFQYYLLNILVTLFGKTPEQGAQTTIHLAVSKDVEGVTGKFFGETTPSLKPRLTDSKKFCEGIWAASEKNVKLKPEEKL
nr:retinol dehydrogenase 13-like [Leptinotarsa decemlineata]